MKVPQDIYDYIAGERLRSYQIEALVAMLVHLELCRLDDYMRQLDTLEWPKL